MQILGEENNSETSENQDPYIDKAIQKKRSSMALVKNKSNFHHNNIFKMRKETFF